MNVFVIIRNTDAKIGHNVVKNCGLPAFMCVTKNHDVSV